MNFKEFNNLSCSLSFRLNFERPVDPMDPILEQPAGTGALPSQFDQALDNVRVLVRLTVIQAQTIVNKLNTVRPIVPMHSHSIGHRLFAITLEGYAHEEAPSLFVGLLD